MHRWNSFAAATSILGGAGRLSSGTLGLLLGLAFGIDFVDNGLNASLGHHLSDIAGLDDAKLNVLLGLDHLEQSLDSQAHGGLLVHAGSVLFLHVLAKLLRLLANSRSFPLTNGARWLGLEEDWPSIAEA